MASSPPASRVFLTGASSGIGEALARLYAARGATLGLLARREDLLRGLAASLPSKVETYPADVTDLAAVKAAAADYMAKHGVPDVVIGNAGVSHGVDTEFEEDIAAFRDILEVNVMGLANTFHPFVGPMRGQRAGRLVGIASVAGYRGFPGGVGYSASKAAAIRYLEGLRGQLRGSGVGVTTICPGYIRTPMTAVNRFPMPFLIEADDAARRFARVIDAGRSHAVVPWQMAIVSKILVVLPDAVFDAVFSKQKRKPRRGAAS